MDEVVVLVVSQEIPTIKVQYNNSYKNKTKSGTLDESDNYQL